MQVARNAAQHTVRSGGGLRDLWVVPAIVAFIVIGVTVGPLKGCLPEKTPVETQAATQTATQISVTDAVPTAYPCVLPNNQSLCSGCINGVALANTFTTYRCDNGQLAEVKSITTTTVLPTP